MSEQIYTKEEFCKRVGIGMTTLEKAMREDKIKPVRIGRLVKFREHHVTEFLDNYDQSKRKPRNR